MQQGPYHSPVIDIRNPAQAHSWETSKTAPCDRGNVEEGDEFTVCVNEQVNMRKK